MNNLIIFLQSDGGGASGYFNFILIGAMILVFWLFMIRPQTKKAKEQKKFINQMAKGDKVVTVSGMHGTIHKINEDNTSFMLETLSGQQIKMEKSSISPDFTKAYYPKPTAGA